MNKVGYVRPDDEGAGKARRSRDRGKALFRWMTKKTIAHARWTAVLRTCSRMTTSLRSASEMAGKRTPRTTDNQWPVAAAEISETAIEMASKRDAQAISEGRVKLHRA